MIFRPRPVFFAASLWLVLACGPVARGSLPPTEGIDGVVLGDRAYTLFAQEVGGVSWNFALPRGETVESLGERSRIVPGDDVVFYLDDDDLFIAPSGDRNHTNLYTKATLPVGSEDDGSNLEMFPLSGFAGVLTSLEGAGYVVLIEEFGPKAPVLEKHDQGFSIRNVAKLRIVFFEDGGYNQMAQDIREWMKEKGYYRNLFDKPFGEALAGAVALRPVQHGAIGPSVWEQIVEIIPKAVLVWRAGPDRPGQPAYGVSKFTVELQKRLDERADYYFLPWAGMAPAVSPEEEANFDRWFAFALMPQAMLSEWACLVDGKPYVPDRGSGIHFHPMGLRERMEYWLYEKMPRHPNTYRIDGANVDTLQYWFQARWFTPCDNPDKPADFTDYVRGYQEMMKAVYDRGHLITHEGVAFFLEKYMFAGYGRPLVTIGANSGFYLQVPGRRTAPSLILDNIRNHIPIHQLVYHDQIAMRLHDAESLNMRYRSDEDYELIRTYKFLFNALYGLTPNVQLGGEKADEWVSEDLPWLRAEMPRAIETYTKTYGQRILEHRFLTDDHLVQQTRFENGIRIIANFDSKPRTVADRTIEALAYLLIEE